MNKIFLGILGLAVVSATSVAGAAGGIGEAEFSALSAAGAFPVPGKNGFTKHDVDVLKRGASLKVAQGSCARVEFGGKSTLNPGEYYLYCGNNRRLIFTEADLAE